MVRRRRLGFTLVELLVVMAILALLIALLLPAVNSVRQAAYKNQCKSNLSQLGKAIANYESAHSAFPLGRASLMITSIPSSGADILTSGTPETPWLGQILEFLDMDTMASDYNKDIGVIGFALFGLFGNATVMMRNIPALNCPADIQRKFRFPPGIQYFQDANFEFAMGNYVASWGNTNLVQFGIFNCQPGPQDFQRGEQNRISPPPTGIERQYQCYRRSAFGSRNVTHSDVTDGPSKTIFMSELVKGKNPDARGLLWLPVGGGNVFMTRFTPNNAIDIIRIKTGVGVPDLQGDQLPTLSGGTVQAPPPNSQVGDFCFNQPPLLPCTANGSLDQTFAGARSRHSGGVHVLLGDGSVQFVSDSVDMDQWVDAASINGDETSPAPW